MCTSDNLSKEVNERDDEREPPGADGRLISEERGLFQKWY